jgi:hypothetical protein
VTDSDEQELAAAALEDALLRYMRARTDNSETMVLEGYIFEAFGRTMENLDNHETSHIWGHMDSQPVHITIGLAEMLKLTVKDWFLNGEPRDGDDDD